MSTSSADQSPSTSRSGNLPLAAGGLVLVGIAVATAAARNAHSTDRSPIEPAGHWLTAYQFAIAVAFTGYVLAAILHRKHIPRLGPVLALAAAIQLTALAAGLLYSKDVYAYWNKGRIQAVHHANLYSTRPTRFSHDPSFAYVADDWRTRPAFYGPTFGAVAIAHAASVGKSPRTAAYVYRVLAAASVAAATLIAASLAPVGAIGAAFIGWNPVLALHFAGGGHNDALMMALFLASLLLYARGRRSAGAIAWVLALTTKWVLCILVPIQVLARRGVDAGRAAMAGALVIGASSAIWGVAWLHSISEFRSQSARISSNSFAWWMSDHVGLQRSTWSHLILALFVVAYLLLLFVAWRRGVARLGLTAGLVVASTSFLAPWYLMWPVSLAAIEEDAAARWLAVFLTGWLLRDAVPL